MPYILAWFAAAALFIFAWSRIPRDDSDPLALSRAFGDQSVVPVLKPFLEGARNDALNEHSATHCFTGLYHEPSSFAEPPAHRDAQVFGGTR
jgi:hypothetical protein